ncbi:MAG: isoprenylcysteine carboxylmethyltransferase family protein [Bacteroidota bacterium]|nr:isoprenylcysteine carboxylmethyltransferase family protein [Bacteroidota bacterium]
MTVFGIGPKIVFTTVPYFILMTYISSEYPSIFNINFIPEYILKTAGILLLSFGILFFIRTQITFIKEIKKGKLITTGTFAYCRNPIYSAFILFIIPSIALLLNSWPSLTASLIAYIVFKINIKKEYNYLRDKFGDEYNEYERKVNEIFPFKKKWF